MPHQHLCRQCGTVIEEGEFDCENDTDHDAGLCREDLAIRRLAGKRVQEAWDRNEEADPDDLRLSQI
jgi:hypothetical protein